MCVYYQHEEAISLVVTLRYFKNMTRLLFPMKTNGSILISATPAMHEYASRVVEAVRRHPDFAEVPYVPIRTEQFAIGELETTIEESVRGCSVFLFHSMFYPDVNTSWVELALALDSLSCGHVGKTCAVLPFISYTREDKKNPQKRNPLSSRVLAKHLETDANLRQIITMDLHAPQLEGLYRTAEVDGLPGARMFRRHLKREFEASYQRNYQDLIVTLEDEMNLSSPDVGGLNRARAVRQELGLNIDVGAIDKQRIGKNEVKHGAYIGPSVKGRKVLLIDDILDTAGSLVKGSDILYDLGAYEVTALCTHILASKKGDCRAEDYIRKSRVKVIGIETIPRTPEYITANSDWLTLLPSHEFFAEAVIESSIPRGSMHNVYKSDTPFVWSR
jgi:ribose-phosphate pyrophosphokinase